MSLVNAGGVQRSMVNYQRTCRNYCYTGRGGVAVCRECKEEFNALTDAGALSQLRIHAKIHQGEKAE